MYQKIKASALQYQAVYNLMKEITNSGNPLSVSEVYEILKDKVKNETQVRDAIRKYNATKTLVRIKEGTNIRYWFNQEYKPIIKTKVITPEPKSTIVENINKPEITVEKHRIIINHALCKIIIELK